VPRLKPLLTGLVLLLTAYASGSPDRAVDDGSGTVHWTYYDYSYTPISDISIAGGSGQLLTQILGNPFNVDQDLGEERQEGPQVATVAGHGMDIAEAT
jgi:hypothetical protein